MKWSYEDPLTIPKDEIRLIVGDTDEGYPMLFDEEIVYFHIKAKENITNAVYACAKAILHKLAYEPDYTIGPESVTGSPRLKVLQKLVDDLDPNKHAGAPTVAEVFTTPQPGTCDIFHVGMMDNGYGSNCFGDYGHGASLH